MIQDTADTIAQVLTGGMVVFTYCLCNWEKWKRRRIERSIQEALITSHRNFFRDLANSIGALGRTVKHVSDTVREFQKESERLKQILPDDDN